MKIKIRKSGTKRKRMTGFRHRKKTKGGRKVLSRQRRKRKSK
jgi:ribosomal protein L34